MKDVFFAISEKERVDTESVGLTCFGVPILFYLFTDVTRFLTVITDNVIRDMFAFASAFLLVLGLVIGFCSLECQIIGTGKSKRHVFFQKNIFAVFVLLGSMIVPGVCVGLNEYSEQHSGYSFIPISEYMVLWAYLIVTITFFITAKSGKSIKVIMKNWKEQDGVFLVIVKILVILNSIFVKIFFVMGILYRNSVLLLVFGLHEWMYEYTNRILRLVDSVLSLQFKAIMPLLLALYIGAVSDKKSKEKREDVCFGRFAFVEGYIFLVIVAFIWAVSKF